MPTDRIIYKRNFQISQFLYETWGQEYVVNEGETMTNDEIRSKMKREIEDWHRKNNPHLATDYFKKPEEIKQVEPATNESSDLEKIKIALNNFQNQADAIAFIEKEFPDYVDHIRVKMIIKTKPIKKSDGKGSSKKK